MRSKNKIRRNLVSWKTKLAAALFSVLFVGVSAIFITHSHSEDEIWMVSFMTVFLAIYAAVTSDISWKMKFWVVLCSALFVSIPAILITCVYPNSVIWLIPVVMVCLAGFYAGVASGVIPIGQGADTEMTFDDPCNDRWMMGVNTLVGLPESPEGPHPMVGGKFQSYAEVLAARSRAAYDDDRGIVFGANESGLITPHGK